ncbi:TPA: hypothetical protein NKQ64_004467 [Vibrio parahaemolyticus]|uniref:hypothetical protein n=1 Tax=Vibrio parahaemolyticus TaxID=670 RepID=UPI00387B092F|nr:hypothetical protein [Vibrio parahaemolyticus]HCE2923503.1 hypothetical protein [Vibrio parahaemolyticus]HCH1769693.1 hypothetical protein [Vibrio parahaemolyticus]HCH5178698.1 hypothetical protein [Vibrio parahaemolyticus]
MEKSLLEQPDYLRWCADQLEAALKEGDLEKALENMKLTKGSADLAIALIKLNLGTLES